MGNRFASSKNAIAYCDICGFEYKLRALQNVVVKGRDTNLKACSECWDLDHPQNHLGEVRVEDPQALRNPRPDPSISSAGVTSGRSIQWGWNPVGGGVASELTPNTLVTTGATGAVTVLIS